MQLIKLFSFQWEFKRKFKGPQIWNKFDPFLNYKYMREFFLCVMFYFFGESIVFGFLSVTVFFPLL